MMTDVGQREILTQQRVVAFFREALGYAYLGHWKDRLDNSNVKEALLTHWLKGQGHSDKIIKMDLLMPSWRLRRGELNRAPLAHEGWGY